MPDNILNFWSLPPRKNVCEHCIFRMAWRISTKFSHKVEGWTGSNPIENGRHRFNRLAAILEKHCFPAPGGLILASFSLIFCFDISGCWCKRQQERWPGWQTIMDKRRFHRCYRSLRNDPRLDKQQHKPKRTASLNKMYLETKISMVCMLHGKNAWINGYSELLNIQRKRFYSGLLLVTQ